MSAREALALLYAEVAERGSQPASEDLDEFDDLLAETPDVGEQRETAAVLALIAETGVGEVG